MAQAALGLLMYTPITLGGGARKRSAHKASDIGYKYSTQTRQAEILSPLGGA